MTIIADIASLTAKELVAVYNSTADNPIKKFRDHKTAVARVTALLETANMYLIRDGEDIVVKSDEGLVYGSVTRSPYSESDIIRMRIDHNPKRAGSLSETRFELYQDGITIGAYLTQAYRIQNHKPRWRHLADIHWDVRKDFIEIETASDEEAE